MTDSELYDLGSQKGASYPSAIVVDVDASLRRVKGIMLSSTRTHVASWLSPQQAFKLSFSIRIQLSIEKKKQTIRL